MCIVARQLFYIYSRISYVLHFLTKSGNAGLFVGRRWYNFSNEWMWKAWETSFPWVVEHACALWERDVICLFGKWKPNTCCSQTAAFWDIAQTSGWKLFRKLALRHFARIIRLVLFHHASFSCFFFLFFPFFSSKWENCSEYWILSKSSHHKNKCVGQARWELLLQPRKELRSSTPLPG